MSWPSRRRQERTSATVTTISMQYDRAIDAPSAQRARARKSSHDTDVYPPAPRLLHERRTWRWTTSRLYRTFCGLHISFRRPPVHEICKNSRRRGVRRQQFQIVILASAHGKKSTNRVEVVSGARELDRVVGEGGLVLRRRREADASAAAVAAVTRAVQRGATTDVSELCAPLCPSSAARADASPRIAPCARGFYRFLDGDNRASVADHFFSSRASHVAAEQPCITGS